MYTDKQMQTYIDLQLEIFARLLKFAETKEQLKILQNVIFEFYSLILVEHTK